jgi:hypothetical protein
VAVLERAWRFESSSGTNLFSDPAKPAPAPRQPSQQEMRTIKDTTADTTIEEKVEERRQAASNDLLTTAAPRE